MQSRMKKNPTCSNSRLDSILVQLISAVKNTRDDEFRAELLFWTLCVRALASRPLSFTLWARGETEHHGREQGMEQSCSCPRGQEVKRERKRTKLWGQNIPFKILPSTTSLLQRLTFGRFQSFPVPIKL